MEKLSFEFTEMNIDRENFTVSFVNNNEDYSPTLHLYIGDIDMVKTLYKHTEPFLSGNYNCFDLITKSQLQCIFYSEKMPVTDIQIIITEIIYMFDMLKKKELNR
jgi:hypothetical protein